MGLSDENVASNIQLMYTEKEQFLHDINSCLCDPNGKLLFDDHYGLVKGGYRTTLAIISRDNEPDVFTQAIIVWVKESGCHGREIYGVTFGPLCFTFGAGESVYQCAYVSVE